MLWVKYDVDVKKDGQFMLLRRAFGLGAWEMFLELIEIAKRANFKGDVLLASGEPCQAIHLAATYQPWLPMESELEAWERFLKICVEMKLVLLDDGVMKIADWKRWHCAPSADPDQVKERVQKSRESSRLKQDVTTCNDMKRDVTSCNGCNDSEQSIAEQNKAEKSREEQASSDEFTSLHRPAAGQPFVALCEESYRLFHPNAGPISSNMLGKAMDFHDRNRGQPSYKGLIVTESDLCAAWKKGVDGTQRALRSDNPPRVPWNYCQTIAQQEIATVVERRFEIEAISKRREKV